MSFAGVVGSIRKIDTETAAQTASELTETVMVDLGHSIVTRGTHAKLGLVVIMNSAEGASALVVIG